MKRDAKGAGTMPATARKLRCAVYTRKSSEEGLDMEFNSLDAQRESCEAFITSQRAEGWVLVRDRYDDGGVSGGTLERPALKRLVADIEEGLIDCVVVYKIDRLSRALMDFSKLVDVFDANQVTFVSVTQSFNTTTSMGRLTLNILLSFAQFEREVIGERIRDKFAASRKRGMWMGGCPPLGYDVRDRKLVVNETEATLVQRIFQGFVELESGMKLARQLRAEGATTKRGKPLNKVDIYRILTNRVYLGDAVHKGTAYPGEHDAILTQAAWDAAHAILQVNPRVRVNRSRNTTDPLLRGLIFDSDGRAMSPSHARGRRGQIYRYYISQAVLKGGATDRPAIARLPAGDIEAAVVAQVRALLRQPEVVVGTWRAARPAASDVTEHEVLRALERIEPLWDELFHSERARIVRLLVDRVDVRADGAAVRLRLDGLTSLVRDLEARNAGVERAAG
ncbi:MAG: recombinase family protein [Alphaproteobacteria bacterium]|nr:recombinase family protein [Alphaproteobacteria bacterium]